MKKFLIKIATRILNLIPLKDFILFESSPDLSDNTYEFYKYLLKLNYNDKYRFIWLLNDEANNYPEIKNVKYINRFSNNYLNKLYIKYLFSVSKFIIDCNRFIIPTRDSQIRIHLSHGMPLKLVDNYSNNVGRADVILSTSDFFKDIYRDIYFCKDENVVSLGYPRNDVLLLDHSVLKAEMFGDKKVIIWMPTYRQHKASEWATTKDVLPLGFPVLHTFEDVEKINNTLAQNNCILLMRAHPAQDVSKLKIDQSNNIIIADDQYIKLKNISLYELLACTDALITDYSSVYYDYMLMDKPIGLTIEDRDEFFKVFRCAFDNFEENIAGEYLYTVQELQQFIFNISENKDIKFKERTEKKSIYHDYASGSSCERLYLYLKNNYNF